MPRHSTKRRIPVLVRESDASNPTERSGFEAWRARCAADIIGRDERLLVALQAVRRVADTSCTVLITGESGTGKELFARALHRSSRRSQGPFVALNCAAIPETMVEDELFGHTRGAFTGAHQDRIGRVAAADGGTLFLDEIGDMPLLAQAKLLRLLQEHVIIPVGADTPVAVDLRIVAATNQPLDRRVADGHFRRDLLFRLDDIPIDLPPLRERGADILELAEFYLADAVRRHGRPPTGLTQAAERLLSSHDWPGNVRELAQVVERWVLLCGRGPVRAADLRLRGATDAGTRLSAVPLAQGLDLRTAMDQLERELIEHALQRTDGNRTEAALLLGVNRTTLVQKIRKHKLSSS